jgi:hypothetical protein
MNPEADTLRNPKLARDLSWHAAMAQHSGGLAAFYVVFDEDTGELFYGLMRACGETVED